MTGSRWIQPRGDDVDRVGGFTLVEALVALAGAGILITTLGSLVVSQSRFQMRNDDAVHAEQTARALFDGMVGELRGAAPSDLLLATPDSVALRFDVLRAVVCEVSGVDAADLFVYDSVAAPNVPSSFRGVAVSGPYEPTFAYADGYRPGSSVSGATEAVCRTNGADLGGTAPTASFRRTNGWSAVFGAVPERGSVVRVYGSLTYSLSKAIRPGELAVRRNGQEFATPLASGARFEFGMVDGSTVSRVATSSLKDVRDVRLVASTVGRNRTGAGRSLVFEAALRN